MNSRLLILLFSLLLLVACTKEEALPLQDTIPTENTGPLDSLEEASLTFSSITSVEPTALMLQMKNQTGRRYDFAFEQNVLYSSAFDDKGFVLVWTPEDFNPATDGVIVNIGGHGGSAFDDFALWYDPAKEHGYALVNLQWWFGTGEKLTDYATPPEMYPVIQASLDYIGAQKYSTLMTGFSRGSANVYSVTALDHALGNDYFAVTLANSGKFQENFPYNGLITKGEFGEFPFEDTHWILYCGYLDDNPDRDGCVGMEETEANLTQWGSTIDLFIKDEDGDHGGFQTTPENVADALNAFEETRLELQEYAFS